MGKKAKFGESEVKKFVGMYKDEKKKVAEIAETFKTSSATVVNYLKKRGVYVYRKTKGKVKDMSALGAMEIHAQLEKAEADVVRLKKALVKAMDKEEKKIKMLREKIKA